MSEARHRLVPASDPDADPACRLTPERGKRRKANVERLFSHLDKREPTDQGEEFVFRGDPEELWNDVSAFVDEEALCCPFFTFEQVEQPDGVLLRVIGGTFSAATRK